MRKETQLKYNIEEILNMYYNGTLDCPDQYPKMTIEECRKYVLEEVYDCKSDGHGYTRYAKGICDDLKFLGNEYIYKVIDKYAKELDIIEEE